MFNVRPQIALSFAAPGRLQIHDSKHPRIDLGNIMRAHKRFADAAEYYTRAIALIGKPEPRHWTYYYERGTCYERMNMWPRAEADLLQALQLSPEQPMTLNYLGYSWVEQHRNQKQAMAYLEKAVRLKP